MTVHERPVGATVEWYTPPELFEAFGPFSFDLDPASPGKANVPWVPAEKHYTLMHDGARSEWDGVVWLNPPYGPAAGRFIRRMVQHGKGMMLLPARTETDNFQTAAAAADVVCFLRDRLHFIRDDGYQARSSFASVLFAFGDECADVLTAADLGWTVGRGK